MPAGSDVQSQPLEDRRVALVSEADVLQGDVAAHGPSELLWMPRLAQARVLRAVVLAVDAEPVGRERVLAIGVLGRAEEFEREPIAGRGDRLAVRAPQVVTRVVGHLRRRVGEEGLL